MAKEIERFKLQKEEALRNVQYESEKVFVKFRNYFSKYKKVERVDNENRKLDMAIKTIEGRLTLKEKESDNLQEINDKMRDEMKGLVMELDRARDYSNKIEREFNSLQDQRNEVLNFCRRFFIKN